MFDDEDEPMTKLINQMMNLEFICCILYGLNEVYKKKYDKIDRETKKERSRITSNKNNINSSSITRDSNLTFEEK